MAGILPGLLLATLYSVYIMIVSRIDKSVVPEENVKGTSKNTF